MTNGDSLLEFGAHLARVFAPLVGLVLAEKLMGKGTLGFKAFVWPFVFIGMCFYTTTLCALWSVRAWFAGIGYAANRTQEILQHKR